MTARRASASPLPKKPTKTRRRLAAALFSLGLAPPLTVADPFTSATVAAGSANPLCLDYCFTGVCVWLVCSLFECHTEETPHVTHRLPDLVVNSYDHLGKIPWVEAQASLGVAAEAAGSALLSAFMTLPIYGGGPETARSQRTIGSHGRSPHTRRINATRFKDVAAIGNPFVNELSALGLSYYLCPSYISPFFPYLQTEYDAYAWRHLVPTELVYPATWIPGLREIGPWPLMSWGSVHPRIGSIQAEDDVRAAAVTAQRGVDIATRVGEPHVYVPTLLSPSDEQTDKWQMLAPSFDLTCHTFGQEIEYSVNRLAEDGGYGWLYWPVHDCCWPNAGVLIAVVPTPPVCVDVLAGSS